MVPLLSRFSEIERQHLTYTPPAYSTVRDLLIGDLQVSARIDKQSFVDMAGEEIDAAIGRIYVLPLSGLTDRATLLLKRISNRIATGELLMVLDVSASDAALRQHALDLLTGARADLCSIAEGITALTGAVKLDNANPEGNGPVVQTADSVSPLDVFEDRVMVYRPYVIGPWYGPSWQPGG